MSEEVERDGKTYVHTCQIDDEQGTNQEVGLFREENRRVYKYEAGRDVMMYDFSLKEGDTFIYAYAADEPMNCKVLKQGWFDDGPKIEVSATLTSADTLDIKYRRLRTWTIGRDNGSGEYEEFVTWIECIGALNNMFDRPQTIGSMSCLAFVERNLFQSSYYLPVSFCNTNVYGCDLPTGAESHEQYEWRHDRLTYELEGNRLHVYGGVFTQSGPNNYAYFFERKTDDPSVHKIEFAIQEVAPLADRMALHATDFYVSGFDPTMNYFVIDNNGEEHPVINKAAQTAYRPLVEEGKVWKVGATGSGNPVQQIDYYYFDGDTIIDGKTCKQMMCQRYANPEHPDYDMISQLPSPLYVGAWYEENKKVYAYDTLSQQFMLMYDFSLGANDTLRINDCTYAIGPRQAGGIKGFKGVYRDVVLYDGKDKIYSPTWLEGIGSSDCPTVNVYPGYADPAHFLMACTVGDEVIFFNDEYEDGATPEASNARKRLDFTHTIKTKPKTPMRRVAENPLYGEYSNLLLGINLDPLIDAYLVRITGETGKVVYEKAINAGNIVGLNIDISSYAKGRYTVTIENNNEAFMGGFEAQTTGIEEVRNKKESAESRIYNLQGQRISSLQKGLNIVNGQKVYVK